MSKSILDTVHEAAQDLEELNLIDKVTMNEFDALCLPPVKKYSASAIKKIRLKYKVSQPVFAAYLNTSESPIKQWEQGVKHPRGISLKMLNIVEKQGLSVLM